MTAQPTPPRLERGYVQIYTGDGKGKSTAAFGLALRAAGAGLRVFIAQFIKGGRYSELAAFERLSDQITIKQYGRGRFIRENPAPEDIEMGQKGFDEVCRLVASGDYQVIIMDEANIAIRHGIISVDQVLGLIDSKPEQVELIITGRGADPGLVERADLVTEMCEVKHYHKEGVTARKGIEK